MPSRISHQLMLTFGVILVAFACFAAAIAWQINAIAAATKNMGDANALIKKFGMVDGEIKQNAARTIAIVLSDGSTVLNMFQAELQNSDKNMEAELAGLGSQRVSGALQQALTDQQQLLTGWRTLQRTMLQAKSEGDNGSARETLQSQYLPATDKLKAASQQLVELQTSQTQAAQTALDQAFNRLYAMGSLFFVAGLAVALISSVRISKHIVRGLNRVRESVGRIGNGDLSMPVVSSGHDEIAEILSDLAGMQARLVQVVTTVQSSAHQVAMASAEIAQGNQSLSSRTEGLVSTVGETTGFVTDLNDAIAHNAQNALSAGSLASAATRQAEVGTTVVARMEQTMQAIDASSQKIAEITSVIDALAFQTNILALNAAVEAARAGENGRGFAVVASEVRTLAGKSAEAAKSIRSLIDDSVTRVSSGSALISQVGDSVRQTTESIHALERLITEIGSASSSQSAGIGQVNDSIRYMDNFTQENAALVEEIAASAASTGQLAADLLASIQFFQVDQKLTRIAADTVRPASG